MQWDDVRLFLALHRARTVGAAARVLGVDPSTVSRRLGALEEALDATLFDRGREGIAPTEAAERLLPVAEEIEAAMTRFTTTAEGLEREVGLALRTVRPVRGDLIVTRIRDVAWVVAAAPKLAGELGTLRRWTDAPWIAWGERLSSIAAARWLARNVAREPALRSDSLRVQVAAVTSGIGIGLVPEPSLAHFGLTPVRLGPALRAAAEELPTDVLYLVTHRALRDVPRVRVVWELLLEHLAGRS